MAEPKTKITKASVRDFLNSVPDKTRKQDSLVLVKLFQDAIKEKPKMWGPSIIGFGMYHYQSEKSSQQGDWPLSAFSPRKQYLTLYIMSDHRDYASLLKKLGKHKISKACLYINKLSDVDIAVLCQLIKKSFADSKKKFT